MGDCKADPTSLQSHKHYVQYQMILTGVWFQFPIRFLPSIYIGFEKSAQQFCTRYSTLKAVFSGRARNGV